MKGQEYGELVSAALLSPYLVIEQYGQPSFVHAEHISDDDVELVQNGIRRVRQVLGSGVYQIVVLDEICVALHLQAGYS